MKTTGTLAVVACAGGIAIALFIAGSKTGDKRQSVPHASAVTSVVANVDATPAIRSAISPASSGPLTTTRLTTPASERLGEELREATDWRVFALSAQTRPKEGGYFYAMYAANLCGRGIKNISEAARLNVQKTVASKGTISLDQLAGASRVSTICASFVAGEAAELYASLREKGQDGLDPIINATQELSAALKLKDNTQIKLAFRALLNTGDPLALSENVTLARILSGDPEAKKVNGYWFDGKIYSSNDIMEFSGFQFALDLAQCGNGVPCQLDETMMLNCISGGDCTKDRHIYLRNQYVKEGSLSEAQFTQVLALEKRIKQALAGGEVGAFVR